MKKIIKNLIPPSKRLILFSCMSLAFLGSAAADHNPQYINVWIENSKGDIGDGTTRDHDQYITVCCGQPEPFVARTNIPDNTTWFNWYGAVEVTSSFGFNTSVVHNKYSPVLISDPYESESQNSSNAHIVFKNGVTNHEIKAQVVSPEWNPMTEHSFYVTSVGTRFLQFDEGTSEWAGVAPDVDWN